MKNPSFLRGMVALAFCTLLAAPTAWAQTTPFTATGVVNAVLAPPIITTNALGQVFLHGFVHTARVQSPDPRATGQELIIADGAYNADGTANLQGTSYLQVGTWDAAGTNFTPTGGMWVSNWRGLQQANNSLQLGLAGYGVGGAIDGWRLEGSTIRGPDPAAPLLDTGTIKPPAVRTVLDSDGFTNGIHGWAKGSGSGTVNLLETNQQMVLWAQFPIPPDFDSTTTCAWAWRDRAWAVSDGQTLELRADLVDLNEASTEALLALFRGYGGPGYSLSIGHTYVSINKYVSGVALLAGDKVNLKTTNIVAILALTASGQNVLLTARVLDKDNNDAVLYERTALDTPASDPTLSRAQVLDLCGVDMTDVIPDPAGVPYRSGANLWLGLWQKTDDSQLPAQAIFDNFALRLHDEPPLGITRAVQLTWPAPAGVNYIVEAAPTVLGPWLPVQDLTSPGLNRMTVPMSGPAQLFRLIQSP